jgi:hypothetical protein
MDLSMRDLERRAAADPADGAAVAALARALVRAGRIEDARKAVRSRIAAAEVDADTLALALEVGEDWITGALPRAPRANTGYVMGAAHRSHDGLAELAPQIAFAGVPGSGARETVLALRDLLGAHIEEERSLRVDDDRLVEVRFALARPWIVTRSYAVRSIRLVTIPVAPHAQKLRRTLLKGTSALAFAVDPRSENETAWKNVATDFRRVHGFAVEALPLALIYSEQVEPSRHKKLTAAIGLSRVPRARVSIETTNDDRVTQHNGTIEVLAFLLAGVASAVKKLAAPRPKFRS